MLTGVVESVLFKGVHYEMMIDTGETVFEGPLHHHAARRAPGWA